MTRIVASTYRYRRPPARAKAATLTPGGRGDEPTAMKGMANVEGECIRRRENGGRSRAKRDARDRRNRAVKRLVAGASPRAVGAAGVARR